MGKKPTTTNKTLEIDIFMCLKVILIQKILKNGHHKILLAAEVLFCANNLYFSSLFFCNCRIFLFYIAFYRRKKAQQNYAAQSLIENVILCAIVY